MSNPLVSQDRLEDDPVYRAAVSRVGLPVAQKRWLITGAAGQLGRDLIAVLRDRENAHIFFCSHHDLDVTDDAAVTFAVGKVKPDIIVNCAAYHNLGKCEEHPELAERVNAMGPLNLALAADEKATVVHVSTNYVFDGIGNWPYAEDSAPNPRSEYAKSKYLGERLLQRYAPRPLVVRTCGLYGSGGNASKGGNFVQRTLSRLRAGETVTMVADQLVQPTYTKYLADRIVAAAEMGATGTLHLVAEGGCSWYKFAETIAHVAGLSPRLLKGCETPADDPIDRPKNGLLETHRAGELGLTMPHWTTQLREYMETL